jgi:TPR repeat protein
VAVEQGLARAQFNLGICYEKGGGVAMNLREAMKYFRLAAQGGDFGVNALERLSKVNKI